MSACPVTSGLTLLLRADTGVTVDGSNRVSNWANQVSPGTGDFAQSTDSLKPVLTANAFCGRPGILFDGTDDILDSAFTHTNIWNGDTGTFFAVLRPTAFGSSAAWNTCRGIFGPKHTTNTYGFYSGVNDAGFSAGANRTTSFSSVPNLPHDILKAVILQADLVGISAAQTIRDINAQSRNVRATSSTNASDTAKTYSIGRCTASAYFQGYIEAIVCFSRALTEKETIQVYRWLRTDFYTPPSVYFVDYTNGNNANDGRKMSTAWKTYEYAIDQAGDGYGTWLIHRRGDTVSPTAAATPAVNGNRRDPRVSTIWERPAITGLTGDFTNGSRLVSNVSGITVANLKHATRYLTAPDGRKYLLKYRASDSSFYMNRAYVGTTAIGGSFQINADDNYSWMSLLGSLDGADQKANWDSDTLDLPTWQASASGNIQPLTSTSAGVCWIFRHIYLLFPSSVTNTAMQNLTAGNGNRYEHCIIEQQQNKPNAIISTSCVIRACVFIGSNNIAHTGQWNIVPSDDVLLIDICSLYASKADIGYNVSTGIYPHRAVFVDPDFGTDHATALSLIYLQTAGTTGNHKVLLIRPRIGAGYALYVALSAFTTAVFVIKSCLLEIYDLNNISGACVKEWFASSKLSQVTTGASLRSSRLSWYLEYGPGSITQPAMPVSTGYLQQIANIENSEFDSMVLLDYAFDAISANSIEYRVYIQALKFLGGERMIVLEAVYIGSDGEKKVIRSTQDIEPRADVNDWTQYLSVTITPVVGGRVTLRIYCAYWAPDSTYNFFIDPWIDGLNMMPIFGVGTVGGLSRIPVLPTEATVLETQAYGVNGERTAALPRSIVLTPTGDFNEAERNNIGNSTAADLRTGKYIRIQNVQLDGALVEAIQVSEITPNYCDLSEFPQISILSDNGSLGSGGQVSFSGTAMTILTYSPTQIDIAFPEGFEHGSGGPYDIRINADDGRELEIIGGFNALNLMKVTGVTPAGDAIAGGAEITIDGNYLKAAGDTEIQVGGQPATVTLQNAGQIKFTAPAGSPGSATLVITRSDGISVALVDGFYYSSGGALTAPTVPQNVEATGTGTTSILVSYEPPLTDGGPAATYEISHDGVTPFITGLTKLSYTENNLTAGTSYNYYVRARNDAGPSPWSAVATGRTADLVTSPKPVITPLSFYNVVTASDGTEVDVLLEELVHGTVDIIKSNIADGQTFNSIVMGYLFIPDKNITGLDKNQKAIDANGNILIVELVDDLGDHQEITLRMLNK